MAKQVTKEESMNIARQFYSEQRASKVFKVKSATVPEFKLDYISKDAPKVLSGRALAPTASDSTAYYYVYNIGDKQGFIIVSGDDRTKPILGYSDEGAFMYESIPEHIKAFMDNYKNQVKAIMLRNDTTATQKPMKVSKSVTAVAPLITTKWGQYAPYNLKTPNYSATGCVATAMAQVMNYHKWPLVGRGSEGYQDPLGSYTVIKADFYNTTYNWNNMLDEYSSSNDISSESSLAVATLMYHCGISLNMNYAGGSLSNNGKIPTALTTYFRYDENVKYYTNTNFSDTEWKSMIIYELDARRPVILGGFMLVGGHSYVGDGYDANQLIHINWGWQGGSDGYFEISSLDSTLNNIYFNRYQDVIIGIQKSKTVSDYSLFYKEFTVNNNNYNDLIKKNTPITISFSFQETSECNFNNVLNSSNKIFSGKLGIALYQNNKLYEVVDSQTITYPAKKFTILFRESLPTGIYQLKPVFKSQNDSGWNLAYYLDCPLGNSGAENIMLTVTDSDLKFNYNSKTLYCESPGSLKSQISNTDIQNLSRLIVIGDIDQGDILRIRDLNAISYIDLKNANILKTEIALLGKENPIKFNVYEKKGLMETALANSTINNIELPSDLKYMKSQAFTYCINIKSFTIPDSITSISDSTFYGCKSLSEVYSPEKLESIGKEAFAWCQSLVKINLPAKVSMIKDLAFNVCSALKEINSLNPTPPTIIGTPFRQVPTSAVIHVPIGSGNLYKTAYGWKVFTNIVADLPINVSKTIYNPIAGDLFAHFTMNEKATINKLTITGNLNASDFAFIRDSLIALVSLNISDVKLPANKIPNEAFYKGSTNSKLLLTEIALPDCLISIGDSAFKDCSNIKYISIPNNLTDFGMGAFEGCIGLTEFKLKNGGSPFAIKNGAIYNSTATSLILYPVGKKDSVFTLPTTVTTIGKSALQSCKNITVINLSDSIKTISDFAFRECVNLNYIILPSKVSLIGNGAFYDCTNLKTIISKNPIPAVIGGNLTFLGTSKDIIVKVPDGSFDKYHTVFGWKDFQSITDLQITKTVINNIAGQLSTRLTETDIATVNQLIITGTIDARDFKTMRDKMPLLTKLDLSATTVLAYTGTEGTFSTTSDSYSENAIPYYAFYNKATDSGKVGLKSIALPLSLDSIDNLAFYRCIGLTTISIPSSVTTIGANAFKYCSGLASIVMPSSLKIIGNYVFAYCSNLTSITIPSTVKSIGSYAFSHCSSLTSLTLPSSTATIGSYAFEYCIGLTSVIIPSSITTIGEQAFASCEGLTSITIPSSITTIGRYAFYNCIGLKVIKVLSSVPVNLTALGVFSYVDINTCILRIPIGSKNAYKAANQWKDFKCIVEGEYSSIKTVNVSAGQLLSALTPTELFTTTNLTLTGTIDARDFVVLRDSMPNLSILDLSEVGVIAYAGTGGTYSTNNTTYPEKTIPQNAFGAVGWFVTGKASLTSVILPLSVNSIGNIAFGGCSNLKSVTIPSSVISIGNNTFYNCTSLTTIDIPSSVTTIGSGAFNGCSNLKSITFPSSVISIGSSAFSSCTGLISIYANSSPIDLSLSSTVFGSANKTTCILYVPYKAKVLYAVANQWKDFTNIVESTQGFLLRSNSVNLPADAGSSTLNITANVQWTASSDQTWLTVSPSSGIGDNTFTLTYQTNSSNIIRTAKIFVSANGITSQVISVSQIGVAKSIDITAGTLATALTSTELDGIVDLTITGTIDARDFKTMRDNIPNLAKLDLSKVTIAAYTGTEGTLNNNISYTYPENTFPDYAFFNTVTGSKVSLTSVIIPSSATSIGYYALVGCTGLSGTLNIPSNVTSIGYSAFSNCIGINSIIIPKSVTSIGSSAFSNCVGMTSIYAYSTIPIDISLMSNVFNGVNKATCTLYVPKGSISEYQAANQWQDFAEIIEMITTDLSINIIEKINIFPNPVTDAFQINGVEGLVMLRLLDINGRLLLAKKVTDNESVSVCSLPKGLYIVKLITADGTLERKVIKK
ncbi:MAG: leucine-rich repeat protein [Paludibacter sp.]